MSILVFGTSNSSKSIKQQLAIYAASMLNDATVINLTDYDIPLFDIDIEENDGFPDGVKRLHGELAQAESIVISNAEHNGNPTAFFKSIVDWLSRYDRNFLQGKELILLSTSPGRRGGQSSLGVAEKLLPHFGAEIVATLSIGKFYDVFKEGELIDPDINQQLSAILAKLN